MELLLNNIVLLSVGFVLLIFAINFYNEYIATRHVSKDDVVGAYVYVKFKQHNYYPDMGEHSYIKRCL